MRYFSPRGPAPVIRRRHIRRIYADDVHRIARLLNQRIQTPQAAPSLKVTDRAFGTGWRMPLAGREPER